MKKQTILHVIEPREPLLPVPEDLFFPPYSDRFLHLAELVEQHVGLDPADAATIAAVVRSERRAETFDRLSAEAIARGDEAQAMKLSGASERAAAAGRAGMQSLRVVARDRASKISRQNAGQRAGNSGTWGELLTHDDNDS